jgi:hypothetical protein
MSTECYETRCKYHEKTEPFCHLDPTQYWSSEDEYPCCTEMTAHLKDFPDTKVIYKFTKDFLGKDLVSVKYPDEAATTMSLKRFDELFICED